MKIFNLMILKGNEEVEKVIIQLVIDQNKQTNQMLSATGCQTNLFKERGEKN